MNKILSKTLMAVAAVLAVAIFVVAFLAYFVTGNSGGVIVDGLGRALTESPVVVRLVFGQERLWAGYRVVPATLASGGVALIAPGGEPDLDEFHGPHFSRLTT